ncbi:uncharacterized protein BX663DRAFT_434110, partial [Cokeromyces recurvatus]|uniref:uncharacterized protein n=1 Tax=Cokeromyces recurvatus TaxID=90255 RepID=UPI002220A406
PTSIEDPLSFLLNLLPTKKPSTAHLAAPWTIRWPTVCTIIHEMDHIFHEKLPPDPPTDTGASLVNWLLN